MGFFLDAYDLTFVTAMTSTLAAVLLPPTLSKEVVGYFITLLGYAFTMIARPLGSAIFGNLADRWGRRDTLMITIVGYSTASALTAAIPTYAQAGWAAFWIYSALRFILGIFVGGEYAAGHPFAMEYSAPRWRGLVSGIVQGAFSWGVALGGFVVAAFTAYFGQAAMQAYAWRYVFLTGLIPAVVALYIRFAMPDTPVFSEAKNKGQLEKVPFFSLFRPPALWTFLSVFVFMTGLFFSSYSLFYFATGILEKAGLAQGAASYYYGVSGVIAAIAATLWGFSSDFLGRRKALVIAGVVSAILAIPAFYVWYLGAATNNVALLYLGAALAGWLTQWPWGLVPVYLSERFATQRRASGVGFGYSSGIFISAWMPLYSIPLYNLFKPIEDGNIWFVAAFWLILAGVVYGIAALLGPETIGVDLRIAQEK
ncbi:major facilitator superfamily MFS_1 [Thermoproteus uzoniensis 768-20]|uniref:Major facilitator superfamily MFS_1 n=1 Tax=Thermoproteus uzoniensis (strain 768-20) TaxID=999630 RepID=F2L1Y0_THEU7|nr:major facilitator superfamily MFS_1 [Thermoproteus uzoniensis 768-20]